LEKFAESNHIANLTKPSAQWLDEGEGVSKIDVTIGRIDYASHTVGTGLSITSKLAQMTLNKDTQMNAEGEIQNALVLALREAAALAFINGTGQNAQPLGILGKDGIHSTTATGSIVIADIFDAIEKLEAANIDTQNCHLLASPDVKKALSVALHGNQRAWDSTGFDKSQLISNTHLPAGTILIGDFSPANIQMRVGDTIDLKMVRANTSDRRDLYAFHDMDVLVREPKAFSKIITS
jgi:hypothetical protein